MLYTIIRSVYSVINDDGNTEYFERMQDRIYDLPPVGTTF